MCATRAFSPAFGAIFRESNDALQRVKYAWLYRYIVVAACPEIDSLVSSCCLSILRFRTRHTLEYSRDQNIYILNSSVLVLPHCNNFNITFILMHKINNEKMKIVAQLVSW